MIIKTKHRTINTEKVWGIEFGTSERSFDAPVKYWSLWGKYKSQRAMLQALSDFRKQNPATGKRGGKNGEMIQLYNHYRPVHINYTF